MRTLSCNASRPVTFSRARKHAASHPSQPDSGIAASCCMHAQRKATCRSGHPGSVRFACDDHESISWSWISRLDKAIMSCPVVQTLTRRQQQKTSLNNLGKSSAPPRPLAPPTGNVTFSPVNPSLCPSSNHPFPSTPFPQSNPRLSRNNRHQRRLSPLIGIPLLRLSGRGVRWSVRGAHAGLPLGTTGSHAYSLLTGQLLSSTRCSVLRAG